MSTLEELNLNRNLVKGEGSSLDAISKSLNINIPNDSSGEDAPQVLTGTVITSCIVQSSGSPDRVELSPYITSETGLTGISRQDSLTAYNNNVAVVLINKDGIYANKAGFGIATIQDFNAVNYFSYRGIQQPQIFSAFVTSTGSGLMLPTGWTASRTALGDYLITHNLNTILYTVQLTTSSLGTALSISVSVIDPNFFRVSITKNNFDGLGAWTGIGDVDSDFTFALFNNLP